MIHNCLYLICPTDFLEYTINKKCRTKNYFYTSLGNSFEYNKKTIKLLKKMIKKHNIVEIYFVLSLDNKIVMDVVENNKLYRISALNNFSKEISIQKIYSEIHIGTHNIQFTFLSYYLNKRIKELELQLINVLNLPIKIRGKIYNRIQDSFTNIYLDVVCLKKYQLN